MRTEGGWVYTYTYKHASIMDGLTNASMDGTVYNLYIMQPIMLVAYFWSDDMQPRTQT